MTRKRLLSIMISAMLLLSLFPVSVFAEEAEPDPLPAPSVTWSLVNGIVTPVASNTPEGASLFFRVDGTANPPVAWNTYVDYAKDTAFEFMFGVEAGYSIETTVLAYTAGPIQNKIVTDILNSSFKTAPTAPYTAAEWTTIVAAVDDISSGALTNAEQKSYVLTAMAPYISAIKFYKDIAAQTTDISSSNLNSKYATLTSMRTTATTITPAHFQSYISKYIDSFEAMLDEFKLSNNITSELEQNLYNSFRNLYSRGAVYTVKQFIVDESAATVRATFNTSAGLNSIKYGDYQMWAQFNIIEYIRAYSSTMASSAITITLVFPSASGSETVSMIFFPSTTNDFTESGVEKLLGELPPNFDYLIFDYSGFVNNTTFEIIANGMFLRTDEDWTKKKEADFIDWYTYELAEKIVLNTSMNVKITFFDKNDNLLTERTVYASSLSSGGANFTSIQNLLNTDYPEYEGLKFSYVVNGTTKTVNVVMTGTNFRQKYDEWLEVDRYAFDEWIRTQVMVAVASYQDSDIRLTLYDKNKELIDTWTVSYSDISVSVESVNDYLNDAFYKFKDIYWDFNLTKGTTYNTLTIKGDVKYSNSKWRDIPSSDIDIWVRDMVYYIMNNIAKDLNVVIVDEYNSTMKNYSFKRLGYVEMYDFEQEMREKDLSYNGLEFVFSATYGASQITAFLKGTNFASSDTAWKDVRSTSAFRSWYEDNVVSPTVAKFQKDVYLNIQDKNGNTQETRTYKKDFATTAADTSTSDLVKFLNANLGTLKLSDSATAKITYTGSYAKDTDTVTIKAKTSVSSSSSEWTHKSQFEYQRLINLVLLRASTVKSTVVLELQDSAGAIIDNVFGSNEFEAYTFEMSGNYEYTSFPIVLSPSLVEVGANSYNINAATINVLAAVNAGTKFTIVVPLETPTGTISLSIDKDAIKPINDAGYTIALSTNRGTFRLVNSAVAPTSDVSISMTLERKGVSIGENFIPVTYSVTTSGNANFLASSFTDVNNTYRLNNGYFIAISPANVNISGTYGFADKSPVFTDIAGNQYATAIQALANYGIVQGVGEGKFSPNTTSTRAEMVTMIVRSFAPNTPVTAQDFSDVAAGTWYYETVGIARTLGIVQGIGNNLFQPNQQITNEEVLAVLKRMGDSLGLSASSVSGSYVSNVSSWAIDVCGYMASIGVIDGNTFVGKHQPTRAEMSQLIYKYLIATKTIV